MKKLVALLFLIAPPLSLSAAPLDACQEHIKYGAPGLTGDLLCRLGYALSHNPDRKTPDWVAYHLTREKVHGTVPRSDDFRPDYDLPESKRAELADYKGSGYDRGHMAPAAAMKWSERAMSESFLLSNMAPQVGIGFNRHIWKELESKVREWTEKRGELYVVTGNIYSTDHPKTIGRNHVAVPTHCYKVIFDPVRVEAIAFILPNRRLKTADLPNYIVSVDEVERQTGLDFLTKLNDQVESLVEGSVASGLWP